MIVQTFALESPTNFQCSDIAGRRSKRWDFDLVTKATLQILNIASLIIIINVISGKPCDTSAHIHPCYKPHGGVSCTPRCSTHRGDEIQPA